MCIALIGGAVHLLAFNIEGLRGFPSDNFPIKHLLSTSWLYSVPYFGTLFASLYCSCE